MATAEVLQKVDLLGPKPQEAYLDAEVEKAKDPKALPFDPEKLKQRYAEERDKRLALKQGLAQYRLTDGHLAHYLVDPWVKPGFTRDPVDEDVEVVIIGGGYGAQLVAVRLIEKGITNLRIIEKAGDFGGTWYWNRYPGAQVRRRDTCL